MVGFTSETNEIHLGLVLLKKNLGKLLIFNLILLIHIGLFRLFVSPYVTFGSVYFKELVCFIYVIKFVGTELFIILFIFLLMTMEKILMVSFSILIWVISVFSLFFLVSLMDGNKFYCSIQSPGFCFIDFLFWFPILNFIGIFSNCYFIFFCLL